MFSQSKESARNLLYFLQEANILWYKNKLPFDEVRRSYECVFNDDIRLNLRFSSRVIFEVAFSNQNNRRLMECVLQMYDSCMVCIGRMRSGSIKLTVNKVYVDAYCLIFVIIRL